MRVTILFLLFWFCFAGLSAQVVKGNLRDEYKKPIPYGYLTIYGDQEVAGTCRTDRQGHFEVTGVAADAYHILVRVGNKAKMLYFVYLDPEEEVLLNLNISGKSRMNQQAVNALLGGPPLDLTEFDLTQIPWNDGFDYPVGKPHAKGYYIAQHFRSNDHLGEDWNGNGGGNSDMGDPIHCIASGLVVAAYDAGEGWGNVVRVIHKVGKPDNPKFVESLYAHLGKMNVKKGAFVKRGAYLGTMGNANGAYYAHLHLELRAKVGMSLGGGYGAAEHFINPTAYIIKNRPASNRTR